MTILMFAVGSVAAALALFNALLFLRNISLYAPPPSPITKNAAPVVSVLIPARNEEDSIEGAVRAALASQHVQVEVIVLDDHSTDRTGEIVRTLAAADKRVRLELAPSLPAGWCGKQFACSTLSSVASHEILCFVDSDVRLQPLGLARMVAFLEASGAGLVSGFPHQELGTFFEKLLLPMMHFLLLSFLPMDVMRKFPKPSLAAGCGQLFVARREAYRAAGGHAAIRQSRHDGIMLPKAFRKVGLQTDLCDATDVASCRMYHNAQGVFSGLLKNANEGIAAPIRIYVFTALLLVGHVVPIAALVACLLRHRTGPLLWIALAGTLCSFLPRVVAALRFRQPLPQALLHPFAILIFLGLQWKARFRDLSGKPAVWKGRTYQTT